MKKYILVVCGPLCSGKTTVVDLLLKTEARLFRVSRDKIKRFISDYGPNNYYKPLLDEIQISLIRQAFTNNLNVVVEGSPNIYDDMKQSLVKLSKEFNTKLIEINLEAPLEILTDRFRERIKEAEKKGIKLFCTTEERMLDLYNKYISEKDVSTHLILTDVKTLDEVYNEIKSKIT